MRLSDRLACTLKVRGGVAYQIDARGYKGQQCVMQRVTGTVNAGAHPGSYNGQDAYNDMLVVDDGDNNNKPQRLPHESGDEWCIGLASSDRIQSPTDSDEIWGGGEMNSVVRRLTPMECERLQGMPDDWSKYGTDENGNVYELSDSARYKMQGNGICTPFWRWLLLRISAQYERPATLGSLFSGQGSFEMLWENINGKGSAVWCSEIDKNAQAVARYHFPESEASE